jgi:hypothetical protein
MEATLTHRNRFAHSGKNASVLPAVLALLCPACGGDGSGSSPPAAPETPPAAEITLWNATAAVTQADRGFNDAGGNVGDLNDRYGRSSFESETAGSTRYVERFRWDFSGAPLLDVFTGRFLSAMSLTDTLGTFDGTGRVVPIRFDQHVFNLDAMDGDLSEPGGPRRANGLCVTLRYPGAGDLALRMEIKDPLGGVRYTRVTVAPGLADQKHCWRFRETYRTAGRDLDLTRAKVVALVIERGHVADGIRNPDTGTIDWLGVSWQVDRVDSLPSDDDALLELIGRRSYQYFRDFASRHPGSMGLPADRSTFPDLLSVGGAGFAFASHVVAAHRGWVPRDMAATSVVEALRVLDNAGAFGPERVGRLGHCGFFYHFVGVDGRRKLNFDFAVTAANEAENTVEVSTIDTALAVAGMLVAQSYFDGAGAVEEEIRRRVQSIYDRVDWRCMLEPTRQQLYLGSKPAEARGGPAFSIPDGRPGGHYYSGTPGAPATLDYTTDEALIALLMGIGSTTSALPSSTWCAPIRPRDADGFVRTWPGSPFTFFFLSSFIDPRALAATAACPGEASVDWFSNTRAAFLRMIQAAERNPRGFNTYGPDAWGVSAAEGPADAYFAYGLSTLAVDPAPFEDGTVTYYGALAALPFGSDLRERALRVARKAFERGHWHSRFGLPDAWNQGISQGAVSVPGGAAALRRTGVWVGRATFGIDVGPMLLAIENARSGLVWQLSAKNPNLQRALGRLAAPQVSFLEAESGEGGRVMTRSAASGQRTVLLQAGQATVIPAGPACCGGRYAITLRYSNDNFGPPEVVTVRLDGAVVGSFTALDTGNFGFGWNQFVSSAEIVPVEIGPGASNTLRVDVTGGDGFGVEIDSIGLRRVD